MGQYKSASSSKGGTDDFVLVCSVAKYPSNPCLGHRPIKYGVPQAYQWITYKETAEIVDAVASGIMAIGLKQHGRVGVYGINSPEWMMAMQVRHMIRFHTPRNPQILTGYYRGSCLHLACLHLCFVVLMNSPECMLWVHVWIVGTNASVSPGVLCANQGGIAAVLRVATLHRSICEP